MTDDNHDRDESGLTQPRARTVSLAGMPTNKGERRPALVSLRGELLAVPIPLERDEVTLGRALEADVRLTDFRASRLHARLSSERDPDTGELRWKLTDLASTNGTTVNGQLITEVLLNEGDKI
ncbi:MAG: FHA domain-containing protein, partial [Pyrinomonadaceae bacterium]